LPNYCAKDNFLRKKGKNEEEKEKKQDFLTQFLNLLLYDV